MASTDIIATFLLIRGPIAPLYPPYEVRTIAGDTTQIDVVKEEDN